MLLVFAFNEFMIVNNFILVLILFIWLSCWLGVVIGRRFTHLKSQILLSWSFGLLFHTLINILWLSVVLSLLALACQLLYTLFTGHQGTLRTAPRYLTSGPFGLDLNLLTSQALGAHLLTLGLLASIQAWPLRTCCSTIGLFLRVLHFACTVVITGYGYRRHRGIARKREVEAR